MFGANTGFNASLNLSSLDGTNGFVIDGVAAGDLSGQSVSSAGDVNNDGIDDLIIGAPAEANSTTATGESYVVFGNIAAELDLNGSNDAGLDFTATFLSSPVSVVDTDLTLTDFGLDGNGSATPLDSNSATITTATVTLTNPLDGTAESLAADVTGTSINATYDVGTGVLTLSGTDTVANYEQVLRTVTYNNTAGTPDATDRTIEFMVDDGQAHTNTSAVATTTLRINQAPTVALQTLTASLAEGTEITSRVKVADIVVSDDGLGSNSLSLSGADAAAFEIDGSELFLSAGPF